MPLLQNLHISNYRQFTEFELRNLAQVTLLVGGNNAGKTSVLEAAELLLAAWPPAALARCLARREELVTIDEESRAVDYDVAHAFHGREAAVGSVLRISGQTGSSRALYVQCAIRPDEEDDRPQLSVLEPQAIPAESRALSFESDRLSSQLAFALGAFGTLPRNAVRRSTSQESPALRWPIEYVPTSSPSSAQLRHLWDAIVLTPEESHVLEALQIVEPRVERIAAIGGPGRFESTVVVKLRGSDTRIPIGSMGEGSRRLMALALSVASTSGGCLLVDEIDTGLHYSVMHQMWRLLIGAALRVGVQVIATTHSLDCLQALAELAQDPDFRRSVAVYRIERGANEGIRYSMGELEAAISDEMEIR